MPFRSFRPSDIQDVALALAITALGQLDAWAPSLTGAHLSGPRAVVAGFYAAAALPLLARRRHPLAIGLWVAAVLLVQFLVLGSSSGNGTVLPAMLAAYTIGAHSEPPSAYLGGIAALVVPAVHELRNPNLATAHALARAVAWDAIFVAAWLFGAYLRTRRLYVAELHERAVRAERDRALEAQAAVTHERARIARELHDVIAHGVSVMVVQAEAAQEVIAAKPDAALGALTKIQQTGREALVELRRLVGILRAEQDDVAARAPEPGLARLDSLVEQLRDAGLRVGVRIEGIPTPLPAAIDLSAYRIVQEALTNTLKHAAPARASVCITYRRNGVVVEVSDDGRRPITVSAGGQGLAGMRERVGLFGGELQAGPASEGGFRVRATLPLTAR